MDIDSIINNIKEMLVQRGENIDEFEEHEKEISREEFINDGRIIEFHTSNTTIIFAMTKKLKKMILDELKAEQEDLINFILKYNNKKNIILIFNNDVISAPILQQISKYDKMLKKMVCYNISTANNYFLILLNMSMFPNMKKLVKKI